MEKFKHDKSNEPIPSSLEELKQSIEILPGKYTYSEVAEMVRGKDKYIVSSKGDYSSKELQNILKLISEGVLPAGRYWDDNGSVMGDEDTYFEVNSPEKISQGLPIGHYCAHPGEKYKLALWKKRPDWFPKGEMKFWNESI